MRCRCAKPRAHSSPLSRQTVRRPRKPRCSTSCCRPLLPTFAIRRWILSHVPLRPAGVKPSAWKERGRGDLHVNLNKAGSAARLVMRAKGNLRLILNAKIFPGMVRVGEESSARFVCLKPCCRCDRNQYRCHISPFCAVDKGDGRGQGRDLRVCKRRGPGAFGVSVIGVPCRPTQSALLTRLDAPPGAGGGRVGIASHVRA